MDHFWDFHFVFYVQMYNLLIYFIFDKAKTMLMHENYSSHLIYSRASIFIGVSNLPILFCGL